MSSLTKKILFSLMITLSSILMATTFVRASISFPNGYEDLKKSNTYYCMEHQDGFSAGTWDAIYSQTIRSDDPDRNNRTLAKILYDGIESGQGGYHQDHGGPYQYAIWKWCYVNGINTRAVDSAIYDQAYAAVANPTTYTEAGKAAITLAENQMTMNGMVGSVKIKSITGSISGINIIFKDIVSNDAKNNQTKTIDANSSSVPGWIELYKDEKCTQPIKAGEIKQNDTIYFKNLQPNYWIKKINFSVIARSSGYTVTWTRWRKTTSQVSEQDLMSATKSDGVDTTANVSITTSYNYGKIKIKKVGVYTQNGEEKKTSNIMATFKLYCTTLNKWVSGTAKGRKTYVDSIEKASEYTSTTNVKQLHSTYQYQLVEVNVDNKDYNNPIKMVSAISNLQKDLKVVKKGEYYSTSDVIVYAGKTNEVIVRDEKTSYNLVINKVEKNNTSKKIQGVSFLIYGANNGWVKGKDGNYTYSKEIDKINDYKYTTDENGQIKLPSLKKDIYYVYEISAPKNYALKEQKGYMKDPKEHISGLNNKVNEWSYCGNTKLTENVNFDIENERTTANLTFIKLDEDTKKPIQGVSIKVYSNSKGWLTKNKKGEYEFNKDIQPKAAETFVTDKNGEVKLENLELGTYKLYETETVEGYNIKKQEGYMTDEISKANEWVYLGEKDLNGKNDKDNSYEYTLTKTNIKTININGHVWLDIPYDKSEQLNYVYDFASNDKVWNNENRFDADGIANRDELLSEIKVRLWSLNNNEKPIAESKTDDNGFYEFKDINYKDAQNAYVEFVYDNEKYIVVDTLVGKDNTINSKAKEYTMTTDKLNDQKIVDEKIEGRAVTEKKADALMLTYDAKNYAINDVNLGLMPKKTPSMFVSEELEYIKVELNGFEYTYKYGDPQVTVDQNVTRAGRIDKIPISPTDISYSRNNKDNKLKVYAVYRITVTNTEGMEIDDIYNEKKLYLSNLTNTFKDIFELETEHKGRNDTETEQFKLWEPDDTASNTAKYNLNDDRNVFKDGIEHNKPIKSYIQFKVNDTEIENLLLSGKSSKEIETATQVIAKGYHEYLRTDNVWVDDEKVTAFDGVKGKYEGKNSNNEKYYVHKSVESEKNSSDLPITIELQKSRTISGTVFEDNPVGGDVYKGNGILDDSENARGKDVTVELLDDEKNPVVLYPVNKEIVNENQVKYTVEDPTLATTTTKNDGTYEFDGVVPGYYYIRFTYGNGDQKMVDINGNEIAITSGDYKSTIVVDRERLNDEDKTITEEVVAAAVKAQETKTLEDYIKDNSEWYTAFKYNYKGKEYSVDYSTAIDDLTARHELDDYTFTDGIAYDKDGKPDDKYGKTLISAYTPLFGIKIENTEKVKGEDSIFYTGESKQEFNGFNFGLIKEQGTPTTPEKKIANVKFTNQVGTTLVSDNPADSKSKLLSAVEKLEDKSGSKDAKLEVEDDMIYGSTLEITYTIDILNNTKVEYNTEEFYKYGTIPTRDDGSLDEDKMKKITIGEVEDAIDEKFDFNSSKVVSENKDVMQIDPITETTTDENGNEVTNKYWSIKGWKSIKSGETASVSYTATALIATDALDTNYENKAKIKRISLDAYSSLNSESFKDWKDSDTETTIIPPTGENRSTTYYIVGAAALVLLVGGIVLIKKKVM